MLYEPKPNPAIPRAIVGEMTNNTLFRLWHNRQHYATNKELFHKTYRSYNQ